MCVIGMIDATGFVNRESEVLSQRREPMSMKAMVKEIPVAWRASFQFFRCPELTRGKQRTKCGCRLHQSTPITQLRLSNIDILFQPCMEIHLKGLS